eukprot:GFUD01121525.1.p1 GENE.GFUD01121525.1~~GFUD01121525.1.p1  ORF type:complete len:200 (+),score=46.94 GFUD01121525.1:2-601(+)
MSGADVTYFMYLGWMLLGWGLVLAGILLISRGIRSWLLTALVRNHQLGDRADTVSITSSQPHFYHVPCTEPVTVPSQDPPPLYEDVVGGYNMYVGQEVVPHNKPLLPDDQPDGLPHAVPPSPPLYSELYPSGCTTSDIQTTECINQHECAVNICEAVEGDACDHEQHDDEECNEGDKDHDHHHDDSLLDSCTSMCKNTY